MKPHHIFWSGGPVSTAAVCDMLETGGVVHAHHVRIGAFRQQSDAEYLAVQALSDAIRREYPPHCFTHTVSIMDFSMYTGALPVSVGSMAAHRVSALNYCGRLLGRERIYVGSEMVCGVVPIGFGFTKYTRGGHIIRLPAHLSKLTCSCLCPLIARSHKGEAHAYTRCGTCEGCRS